VTTRPSTSGYALTGAYALAARELKRFVRQRDRVFSALAQPILFWALFGAGLTPSFQPSTGTRTMSYAEYFFPGTVVLIVLFTAIFSTISIIEDRNEGFLQSVLVSPIPTPALILGKVTGASVLALGQGLMCFVIAPLAGVHLGAVALGICIPLLALIALGLTGLGFTIAWRRDSTQGFHGIMMLLLMPMWLLSGAFFPAAGVPWWLGWIITLNPLTYGVAALRRALYLGQPELVSDLPSLPLSLAVVVIFALAMLALAHASVTRGPAGRSRP
jgi:ABC-2 type transport system permease protein